MVRGFLVFYLDIECQSPTNSKEFVQMTSKKHRLIVYGVAVQLLLIAIVCYAAFPVKTPEQPIRLMYQTNAGKVLFHDGERHHNRFGAQGFEQLVLKQGQGDYLEEPGFQGHRGRI